MQSYLTRKHTGPTCILELFPLLVDPTIDLFCLNLYKFEVRIFLSGKTNTFKSETMFVFLYRIEKKTDVCSTV